MRNHARIMLRACSNAQASALAETFTA
jgi:hypothetical protein